MANNGPISVSAPGTSLASATGDQVTFNTQYPFAKLDSTTTTSFQIITLFLAVEPPNPTTTFPTPAVQRNLIYQFAHGYDYVPATWFLVSTDNFQTAIGSEGVYLTGGGNIPTNSSAVLVAEVDTQNVYFYIDKYWDGDTEVIPNILGTFIAIRSYIFANDLSGTDVPSQA